MQDTCKTVIPLFPGTAPKIPFIAPLTLSLSHLRSTWVNFKLFGGMGLMVVFVIAQALYLSRHIKETDDTTGAQP